jgi:hypothetical protein
MYYPFVYGRNHPSSMTGCHICRVSNQSAKIYYIRKFWILYRKFYSKSAWQLETSPALCVTNSQIGNETTPVWCVMVSTIHKGQYYTVDINQSSSPANKKWWFYRSHWNSLHFPPQDQISSCWTCWDMGCTTFQSSATVIKNCCGSAKFGRSKQGLSEPLSLHNTSQGQFCVFHSKNIHEHTRDV